MKTWHRHLISLLALLLLGALAAGSMKDDDEENEKVESAKASASVSAQALFEAYEANEVAADDAYKDKVLEVSGTVDDIGKDILDDLYLTLGAGERTLFGVQAYFTEAHKGRLAKIQKGQSVKVKCRCEGKMANVLLKNCTFI